MMTDNIIELKYDKNEKKALLEQIIRELPDILAFSRIKAEMCRSDYCAYLDQGFTEEQALELCRFRD